MTTPKALLTGGTGFLGSHVAEMLCERGFDVRATVRSSSDLRWIESLPLELVEADFSDPTGLAAMLAGVDTVVHIAGITRAADPAAFERVNAAGTGALAAAAGTAGVERFVYVSSLAARGPDGAAGPTSAYGRSKRGGEQRLAGLANRGAAPPIVRTLRPGGIYGPRDDDLLMMFQMARRGLLVVPASRGRLQPVHVLDVARSVVSAAQAEDSGDPGPLPVAGSEIVDWADVANTLRRVMERKIRVIQVPAAGFMTAGALAELASRVAGKTPAFDRRKASDLTRTTWTTQLEHTTRVLDWKPEIDIETGMTATAAWYVEQGWLDR